MRVTFFPPTLLNLIILLFPNTYFSPCLQIHHILPTITWTFKPTLKTPFTKFFLGPTGLRGGLSLIYTILTKPSDFFDSSYISYWESELSAHFTLDEWIDASSAPLKHSKCVNHVEWMCQIHFRWHLTPVRLAHTSASSSHSCWRQCGNELLHMWWSCPTFSPFWLIISDLITEITNLHLVLTPELAVLNLTWPKIPYHFRAVIHHILLAARTSTTPTLT